MNNNETQYTYGTDYSAASRLEKIGEHFNPLASDFIRQFKPGPEKGIAVDLGCGPGFTTGMLAEVMETAKTYGLDSSGEFLEMASQRFTNCTFLEHDITRVPFPVSANVMYARFLLCHLKEPLDVIDLWITQMNPEGLLFIEETDWIETDLEVFNRYLDMAEGIVSQQGASLFVGKILETAEYKADVLLNTSCAMSIANCMAASWFYPNTQTIWKENSYVLQRLCLEEIETISQELAEVVKGEDAHSNITWNMRRLVLKKKPENSGDIHT